MPLCYKELSRCLRDGKTGLHVCLSDCSAEMDRFPPLCCSIFGKHMHGHLDQDRRGLIPVGLICWSVLNLHEAACHGEELPIPSRHSFHKRQTLGKEIL